MKIGTRVKVERDEMLYPSEPLWEWEFIEKYANGRTHNDYASSRQSSNALRPKHLVLLPRQSVRVSIR